jgi:hypothetical protein
MYSKYNQMHTLWVVGKPDFQENWAASVVSANKCFHLVGSYFVPSFVSPSLVKPTSNCFYCRCIQCFNIVTWSRLDQIHMHAFFPQGPSHAILLQHNLYCRSTMMGFICKLNHTWADREISGPFNQWDVHLTCTAISLVFPLCPVPDEQGSVYFHHNFFCSNAGFFAQMLVLTRQVQQH